MARRRRENGRQRENITEVHIHWAACFANHIYYDDERSRRGTI